MAQSTTTREFAGGGTVEDLAGGMVKITTSELTRYHVDALYEQVVTLFSGWRSEAPIRLLFDVRHGATTPYFRQRSMELYALARSLPLQTRQAFVIDEKYVSDLRRFVNLTGLSKEHQLRIFTDNADAMQWLEEGM